MYNDIGSDFKNADYKFFAFQEVCMIKQETNFQQRPYWIEEKTLTRTIPLHWHTYYELELVTNGSGKHLCNGVESVFQQGSVFFLSPQDFHQIELPPKSEAEVISLCFQDEALSAEIKELLKDYPTPHVFDLSEALYSMILFDLHYLDEVISKHHDFERLLAVRSIELIIIQIIENSQFTHSYVQKSSQASQSLHDLQPIIGYINSHYDEPLNRDDLAKMAHLSPSYLSYVFKKFLGITLTDYIINCRMKEAKSLLKNGNESIKNTMERVGYNSASLFYRHFYQYYGIKPSEMQRGKTKDKSSQQQKGVEQTKS